METNIKDLQPLIGSLSPPIVYAAIVSAKLTIEDFLHDSPHPNLEMKSIHHKICWLESSILPFSCFLTGTALETQIKGVLEQLKDLKNSNSVFFLEKFNTEISSLTVTVKKELQNMRSGNYSAVSSEDLQPKSYLQTIGSSGDATKLVGLDVEIRHLKDRIYSKDKSRLIIHIVGMAGLGKTTLVQQVCQDPKVLRHFDLRCFMTVGPKFDVSNFLPVLLGQMEKQRLVKYAFEINKGDKSLDELQRYVFGYLRYCRYLIVLDDVWSAKLCYDLIGPYFPDNKNRSRIIITTRSFDVAQFSRKPDVHEKMFLDNEDSWTLLRETVFTNTNETCSPHLEKLGRKISKKCEGHPMAIVAVGKQLRTLEKTEIFWEKVSEEENPLDIVQEEYLSEINKLLSLSYVILPLNLKPCFLHIGTIPHGYVIFTSKLIKLWLTEGIIVPDVGPKSLEYMAMNYLQGLVSASVVLVQKQSSLPNRPKICKIHVIFRNPCIKLAQSERFCYVIKKYVGGPLQGQDQSERLCFHNNGVLGLKQVYRSMESMPHVRSLLCFGPQHKYPLRVYLNFGLLRVLDALRIHFYVFPQEVFKLICLRYLGIKFHGELPKCISKLQNLEVLIMDQHWSIRSPYSPAYLPMEIWNLQNLRHLHCTGVDFPELCTTPNGFDVNHKLQNLLTLSGVSGHSCKSTILARIPNLKKLGIRVELAPDEVETLSFFEAIAQQLHNLESLSCTVLGVESQVVVPPVLHLPNTLKKLALSGCRFPWSYMNSIGELPYLEVLKLRCYAFCGPVWEVNDCEFEKLSLLLLEDLDLEELIADSIYFPSLRSLIIRHCYNLSDILLGGVDCTPVLDMIDMDDCMPSLTKQIQEQLKEYGYDFLKLVSYYSWEGGKKPESTYINRKSWVSSVYWRWN